MLASLQMHVSMKSIFLHVVSRVWSRFKDATTPKEAAFCCHTAALLDSSSLKFKVECSHTYLVLATRDLIYDQRTPQPDFQRTKKNYSSCISRLQQSINALTTVYYLAQISISATSVHRPALMKTHANTFTPLIGGKQSWRTCEVVWRWYAWKEA